MKNKTCGECRFFESKEFICCHSGDEVAAHFIACIDFEPVTEQKPTNGDKIRQGGDVALINFYAMERCKICAFNGTDVCNQTECAYGLAAWLKQEAKDE